MALTEIGGHMDASTAPIADASWISMTVGAALNYMGFGGLAASAGGVAAAFGLTWRASARVSRIEAENVEQKKINADVKGRLETLADKHGNLEVAVAQLPRREEMRAMFGDLREEIRDLKRDDVRDPKR
jgi:hypothetical protein